MPAVTGASGRRRRELLAEGTRIGEAFGLGPPVAAWTAVRSRSAAQWGCAFGFPLLFAVLIIVVAATHGTARWFAIGAVCCTVIAAVLTAVLAPQWGDRLFRYRDGIAQVTVGDPQPRVLRWDDIVTVSLAFGDSDASGPYLRSCTVNDRAGTRVTADGAYRDAPGRSGCGDLAAEAERVGAARIVPALIREYESAGSVAFGRMTVSREGITFARPGSSRPPWHVPWESLRGVRVTGPGERISVTRDDGRSRGTYIGGCPNGLYAHRVIEHAAGTGVPISYTRRYEQSAGS